MCVPRPKQDFYVWNHVEICFTCQSLSCYQTKSTKDKTTSNDEKHKKLLEGSIQVIQKGVKEILTLNKIPENAVVITYKPDIKMKKEDAANTKKSEETQPSKATDKTGKGSGLTETNDAKTKQTSVSDNNVS